ncbi:MAG: phospholipase D family protein [Rhodocyclaceae bacterium]|nr:phospholipase D family protein [Rhodocyclaceae bacterium]MBX3670174.1 phospholipase D family protein [Rhodocyclaceae bacterium]
MNPRLFCREQSYHKALFLTYSFDPIFFEQVVLPDLWAGRSSDILVLGDQAQIEASTQAAAGQLWHLGRHYLLAGANHTGAFHPKVFLRLGPKDGIVMLGSGNVTSSGWGGNQELGTAWMVGPEHADKGGWLHPFLDSVLSWCAGELEHDAVRRMKDVPWLSLTPVALATDSVVLHSRQGLSLAPTLAQRWAGRRFDEVRILTGSTDESGAFLRWAHSTFGVQQATIALTPSSASFDLDKLADLPLKLRIIPAPADRAMHAKFYWFDGPDGSAAVMGSANCSAAAWLLVPDQGGNIETLVAYDQPNPDDFVGVLSVFAAPASDPVDVLLPRPATVNEPDANALVFRLKSLQWDSEGHRLQAEISPAPESGMKPELVVGGIRFSMQPLQGAAGAWVCDLPEDLASATVFASVEIFCGTEQWATLPRWVNDVAALEHASHAARLLEPFKGLERSATSTEQRQMLDELQDVAHALFNDTAAFRDPGFGSARTKESKNDTPASPVNPADLIVHLEEHHEGLPNLGSAGPGASLSLTGILRLLFDGEAEESADSVATKDEEIDEGQLPDDGKGAPKKVGEKTAPPLNPVPIEERFRDRLAAQISTFLTEMSSPAFAERCSATQMVQAVSFPLAVALRGQRRGWVKPEVAEQWALEVFSILFRGKASGPGGLLHAVEQRYAENDQHSTFEEVVGDGTLWMVLVATLGNSNWQGVGTDIDKAVALREVFTAPQLLASAVPARVAALIGRIRIDDARSYLADVAPTVTRLLEELDSELRQVWEVELRQQGERGITHKVGDLLWREKIGWAICLEEAPSKADQPVKVRLRGKEKAVMNGYYANVSDLANRDAHLGSLIDNLRRAVSATTAHPEKAVAAA